MVVVILLEKFEEDKLAETVEAVMPDIRLSNRPDFDFLIWASFFPL